MSQKRKNQRANHEAKEKKQAETVVSWIIGVLIVMAICYAVYASTF